MTVKRAIVTLAILALLGGLAWYMFMGNARHPGLARNMAAIRALPYNSWSEVPEEDQLKNGVVHYDASKTFDGVNLYTSEDGYGALLMDMSGNRILQLKDARTETDSWKLIKPVGAQKFAVLAQDGSILQLDKRSQIEWARKRKFHHDFEVTEDGLLYAIDARTRQVDAVSEKGPIVDDHLIAIAEDESLPIEVSSADLILGHPALLESARTQYENPRDSVGDVFHTNTISRIPGDLVRDGEVLFAEGDLLICWHNLDTIAVIDPSTHSLRWYWGPGDLDQPHNPTLLENGNILIFDNGSERGWSRIIELDPLTREIVWEYRGDPLESFFSASRGSAQRLPNGNTLVTDSVRGRVFEVSMEGEIVWEFFEPATRWRDLRLERATIYRMTRLPRWPLIDPPAEAADAPESPDSP
jgi:outer membrane protein assembly factor BamB